MCHRLTSFEEHVAQDRVGTQLAQDIDEGIDDTPMLPIVRSIEQKFESLADVLETGMDMLDGGAADRLWVAVL